MLHYIVVGCITLILVFLATALALWLNSRRDDTQDNTNNKSKQKNKSNPWSLDTENIDWKLLVVVVVCGIMLLWAFDAWCLLLNFWFIVFTFAVLIVYLFLRDKDEKTKKMKVTWAGWLLLLTLIVVFAV